MGSKDSTMTKEQAIKMIQARLECLTRETSGCDDDCNMHRCNDCNLNYDQGNMGEQKEWMNKAIKSLQACIEVANVLDELETYTASRPKKEQVHITVEQLQKHIDTIKEKIGEV